MLTIVLIGAVTAPLPVPQPLGPGYRKIAMLAAILTLSVTQAAAFSERYSLHIGWPATLSCKQFTALKGSKREAAIQWLFGYISSEQAGAYEQARSEAGDNTTRLQAVFDSAMKPEDIPAYIKKIEKACHERPGIMFSDAMNLVD